MPVPGRLHSLLVRVLPRRLGARFALTVVLTNLVAVLVALAFMLIGMRLIAPQLEDTAARIVLDSLDQAVREQAAAADSSAAVFSVSTRMLDAARTGVLPEDLSATLDAYAQTVGASALVLIDSGDQVVYAYGEPADVTALRAALVARGATMWSPGALNLNGKLTVAAARGITGPESETGEGWFSVATPLATDSLFTDAELTIAPPEAPTSAIGEARHPEDTRFDDISVSSAGGVLHLEAEIPGVDARTAATAIYEGEVVAEPWVTSLGPWALGAVLVASLFGLAVGLVVARTIMRPIVGLADVMGAHAADTMAGRTPASPGHDAHLPIELANLIGVFDSTFTELSEHQAALARAKEEALAAKATLDIAFVDSLEGKILVASDAVALINPAACSHLGVRAEDALGASPESCFASAGLLGEDLEVLNPGKLISDSLKRATEAQMRIAGRGTRWIEVHTVTHEPDGRTLLISTRDVTEERRVNELRNEIVGLVSHDLRAPLTVIAGYLDLLGHEIDDASRAKAIASAQRSAARMKELLEDLLAATRAEEMFSPAELGRVALRDLADDIVVSFQHTSNHELHLTSSCPGEVLGEEKRLRQVLVNLVTNAMKYSPEETRIEVSVTCKDGNVTLAVEDGGPGVPPDDREKVFERFARLESGGSGTKPGVGLGLYIVRAIVESHGGGVMVTDRLDGEPGARFEVTLPAAPLALD